MNSTQNMIMKDIQKIQSRDKRVGYVLGKEALQIPDMIKKKKYGKMMSYSLSVIDRASKMLEGK